MTMTKVLMILEVLSAVVVLLIAGVKMRSAVGHLLRRKWGR
jgi:hypothetical protein